MASSMQARESLGNLSELVIDMLGDDAAAIGAHVPGATPEDKLADDPGEGGEGMKRLMRDEGGVGAAVGHDDTPNQCENEKDVI